MPEIYVSWVKGLPQDEEALRILRENNLGVEMSNIDGQVEMIQDAGVRFSSHTPGLNLTLNLAKPDFMEAFEGEQGERLLQVIKSSDAQVVGFHLGYSANHVYKMMAYPNIPTPKTIITDRQVLLETFAENLARAWSEINRYINRITGATSEAVRKTIVVETLDFSRKRPILWNLQSEEAKSHQEKIQGIVDQYGINAGILHVTEPSFIKDILKKTDSYCIEPGRLPEPVEFLFDVGHNFISADAKINNREFSGSVEDYFEEMLRAAAGRVRQLHLTVPAGNDEEGYSDQHRPFTPGDPLSDRILGLSKLIYKESPEVLQITLEIKTDLPPVDHAKKMVAQAEYIVQQLGL